MAYATSAQVKARAGRLASPWGSVGVYPADADLTTWLGEKAAEIDAVLAARGYTVPATGAASLALESLNAAGALWVALDAAFPEDTGARGDSQSGLAVRAAAYTEWSTGIAALIAGTHPAVLLLASASSDAGPLAASCLASSEPDYDAQTGAYADNPSFAPALARDSIF